MALPMSTIKAASTAIAVVMICCLTLLAAATAASSKTDSVTDSESHSTYGFW